MVVTTSPIQFHALAVKPVVLMATVLIYRLMITIAVLAVMFVVRVNIVKRGSVKVTVPMNVILPIIQRVAVITNI
jgi:hypothetical protein